MPSIENLATANNTDRRVHLADDELDKMVFGIPRYSDHPLDEAHDPSQTGSLGMEQQPPRTASVQAGHSALSGAEIHRPAA